MAASYRCLLGVWALLKAHKPEPLRRSACKLMEIKSADKVGITASLPLMQKTICPHIESPSRPDQPAVECY